MANGDDLIRELSKDIDFLRATPEEQRAYLAAKDPNFPTEPGQQEAYRQNTHNKAVTERNAHPTEFERAPSKGRGYISNVLEAAPIPHKLESPFAIPGISHAKAAYETGMAGVRGAKASVERGEPWYKNLASAAAPLINLNEEQVRRAGERGDTAGVLGAITPAALTAILPFLSRGERAPAGARETTMPRARAMPEAAPAAAEPLRPLPGPLEGPRRPTTVEALDAATQAQFPGRKFGDLSTEQQSLVMRSMGERTAGGRVGEERVIKGTSPTGAERRAEEIRPGTITPAIPIERRRAGGEPMGAPPGGVERRQPIAGMADWNEAFTRSAVTGQPTPGETLAQTVKAGETVPPEMEGRVVERLMNTGRWGQFKALDERGQTSMAREVRDEILREQRQPGAQGPLPGTSPQPGGPGAVPPATPARRGTVPAAPIPTRLTPVPQGTVPSIEEANRTLAGLAPDVPHMGLEEILRRATGQPEPQRAKPGVPLGEQIGKKE